MGQASSMGALLLAGGAPKKRYACRRENHDSPTNGRISGASYRFGDSCQGILRVRDILNDILVKTLQARPQCNTKKDTDPADYFMSASESREYGIID